MKYDKNDAAARILSDLLRGWLFPKMEVKGLTHLLGLV